MERRRSKRSPLLQGFVWFGNSEPAIGARVVVREGERLVGETSSDARGYWSLPADPEGTKKSRYDVWIVDDHSCVLSGGFFGDA